MFFPSKPWYRVVAVVALFYAVLLALFLIFDNSTTVAVSRSVVSRSAISQNQSQPTQQGYYSLSTCGHVYGNFWSGDQLDNEIVGGTANQQIAIRWRSEYSGEVTHFRWHSNFSYNRVGYHAGDGGVIQLELHTDDGRGFPSGEILASHVISGLADRDNPVYFPQIVWDNSFRVTAGEIYHVLFKNIHANPAENYISINMLHQVNPTQRQKCLPDSELAVLNSTETRDWAVLGRRSPSHEFYFSDGRTQGLGYIHTWSSTNGQIKYIEGQNKIREIFTISDGSIDVTDISVRVSRNGQTLTETVDHPLTAHLVDITNDTEISRCILPQESIADGCPNGCLNAGQIEKVSFTYATCDWSNQPISLFSGNSYAVELSAPPNVPYTSFMMQQGDNYGYSSSSYFSDGHAEFTVDGGATWSLWTNWNNGPNNRRDGDLQFFMSTVDPSVIQIENDANCNRAFGIADALLILQYSVSAQTYADGLHEDADGLYEDADGCLVIDNETRLNADVDDNGTIDVIDALLVLQCATNFSNFICPNAELTVSTIDSPQSTLTSVLLQDGQSTTMALYAESGAAVGTFEVTYDSDQGQLIECTMMGIGACNESTPGLVQVSFADTNPLPSDQPIAKLTFEGEELAAINVRVITLVDMAGHELAYTIDTLQIELKNHIFVPIINY